MSQIQVCSACGAKIEIEDHDNLETMADGYGYDEENLSKQLLCENCHAQHSLHAS